MDKVNMRQTAPERQVPKRPAEYRHKKGHSHMKRDSHELGVPSGDTTITIYERTQP